MIKIRPNFIQEALDYAKASKKFTSNRHDFHAGGLDNKQQKMYEGKLGEKIFKEFLLSLSIPFEEDNSPHTEADNYDFIIKKITFDVKTRTQPFHTRTLEMVEQMERNPKNIYISVSLSASQDCGDIIGWCTSEDFLNLGTVENQGYLDNYVLYDKQLRSIESLELYIKSLK